MEKTEDTKEKIVIVNELPVQQYSIIQNEDGSETKLITINEAINEMYKDIKEIKKALK